MVGLNLCDLPYSDFEDSEFLVNSISNRVSDNRIFVGSYFCDQKFLRTIHQQIDLFCKAMAPDRVALVLPVFGQRCIMQAKSCIDACLVCLDGLCDEIVVNDPGMLRWISMHYSKSIFG